MPQPRKKASPAPKRKPAARKAKPAAAAPAPPAPSTSADDFAANLGVLRERLVSSLTLTTDRLQDAVDDAVRRGRMTRKDAEELLSTLRAPGRGPAPGAAGAG